MSIPVPASHRDLLEQPVVVVLATIMPNGQRKSTVSGACMMALTFGSSLCAASKRKEICANGLGRLSWPWTLTIPIAILKFAAWLKR